VILYSFLFNLNFYIFSQIIIIRLFVFVNVLYLIIFELFLIFFQDFILLFIRLIHSLLINLHKIVIIFLFAQFNNIFYRVICEVDFTLLHDYNLIIQ
jgi:hypothetical protein